MIEGVEIKKLKINSDERGWLAEVFRQDETKYRLAMAYVSETKTGVIRGPHEHAKQSDYFIFISGKFILYLWDNRTDAKNCRECETLAVGGENPCSVLIPPGVVHAYKCVSETPGLIINFPDALFMGEGRREAIDEIRWEADPNSPFTIT